MLLTGKVVDWFVFLVGLVVKQKALSTTTLTMVHLWTLFRCAKSTINKFMTNTRKIEMDIKRFVSLVFEDMTSDQKIAMSCLMTGKNVDSYCHLDSGRKSMVAGNAIRSLLSKDPSLVEKVWKVKEEASKLGGADVAGVVLSGQEPPKEKAPQPVVADGEWPWLKTAADLFGATGVEA